MPTRSDWIFLHPVSELLRHVKGRDRPQQLAVESEDECSVSLAQSNHAFGNGRKHWFKVECRTAYDAEYIGRGGLLLHRVTQLVEQARVLDGDDGLISESLDEFDLLCGKWSRRCFAYKDYSDDLTLSQQRGAQCRPPATNPLSLPQGILWVLADIW